MRTADERELRRRVAEHATGPGRRYAAEVRALVVDRVRAAQGDGRSVAAVATELGIRVETVRRWCREGSPPAPTMRAVEVVPEPAVRVLAVVSPSGVRVEGVTLDEAVAMLRALG